MCKSINKHYSVDFFFRSSAYFLFFVFVFFPYISFVNLGTDMQPHALIIAFVLFFFFRKKFSPSQLYIALIFLSSILVFLTSEFSFISLRSLFNYASLFFVSYTAFQVLKTERLNFESFLKSSIIIWFSVGLIQAIYNRDFLNFLISSSRTTEDRGVTGLAPEPTFYGVVFIFFLLFLLHTDYKNKRFFITTCVVGIVFLAQSSMAFLFLAIMFFLYLLTHASIKYVLFAIVLVLFTPFLIIDLMSGTRLSFLMSKILDEPGSLVLLDASINDRFFHVFFALKGLFGNFMLPNGFSSWDGYVSTQLPKYSDLVIIEWFSVGGRIMSGYGAIFYELGIIAILVPMALFGLYFSIYRNDLKKVLFFFFFVNAIMFSAIPIGFSLFAFYIGFLSYLAWKKRMAADYYV